jgi:hypothetical protein
LIRGFFKMIKNTIQPLTNLQLELLQLYSTGISDENLIDLKAVISQFLFEKATTEANKIWVEKNYSLKDVDKWLNK